jgi:hypothetical protein
MVTFRPRRGRYLENGPHAVEVTVAIVSEGRTGRRYTPGETFYVDKVLVQPSAGNALKATENRAIRGDLTDETTLKIMGTGRKWPGGPHSWVKIIKGPPSLEGKTFQQAGEPLTYDASPMTRHFSVRCDTLGTAAK